MSVAASIRMEGRVEAIYPGPRFLVSAQRGVLRRLVVGQPCRRLGRVLRVGDVVILDVTPWSIDDARIARVRDRATKSTKHTKGAIDG